MTQAVTGPVVAVTDVADLATFLASQAADYMTGQSINIDGGLMMN